MGPTTSVLGKTNRKMKMEIKTTIKLFRFFENIILVGSVARGDICTPVIKVALDFP
jgi:hypothetical protein